jgi:hypothetical protein
MKGSKIAWPLLAGLLVGGWAAAHGLAYRIAVPDAAERRHVLEETGHAYLDPAPLLALILSLLTVGFGCCLLRGSARFRTQWAFALLPPGAFIIQEHLERALHDGRVPLTAALDPTFAVGLLLQLPFAVAALFVARALIALAGALTRPRRGAAPSVVPRTPGPGGPVASAPVPRIGLLALGHGQRAPPALLLR